ncbi:hypothetical protein LXM94_02085 [Rhizobium sp. TRM95111]|uniref:hypothetical protein n=1 Tax=Rhizobium alarense TaxID=2846851 RepID=UPI001F40D6D7|nr:hypothetical protein [Rhizobium alarense]MCF3638759.1 hypothetical protein [Rhizobium alarense]
MKTGTLVDATIVASASEDDGEGHWVEHKGRPAVRGFKAHVGADAEIRARLDAWNQPIHRIRGRIGTIFGTWKRSHGLRRMQWRGLAKAAFKFA